MFSSSSTYDFGDTIWIPHPTGMIAFESHPAASQITDTGIAFPIRW
jgi:hypothetical protein